MLIQYMYIKAVTAHRGDKTEAADQEYPPIGI